MLCTGLEIRSVRAVSVVDQWPFRVRDAEREGSIRLEDAEAFAEQMRDRFRIIQVLEEVLGEDQLAAVGLERQTPAEVEGQVRRWEEVDVQEVCFLVRAAAKVELPGSMERSVSDLSEALTVVRRDSPLLQKRPHRLLLAWG
jgi:hypothetical protein